MTKKVPDAIAVVSTEDKGIYDKFTVFRNDGQSALGGKHFRCDYFVLDLTHDPYAWEAILAYASACAITHPKLAEDLLNRVQIFHGTKVEEAQDG